MEDPAAIDVLLARARAGLDRVPPGRLDDEVADGAVVVDMRPIEQRTRDGAMPGAVVVDRNVLEWRLDPSSPHRLPVATGTDVRYVLVGGFQGWLAWRRTAERPTRSRDLRHWEEDERSHQDE